MSEWYCQRCGRLNLNSEMFAGGKYPICHNCKTPKDYDVIEEKQNRIIEIEDEIEDLHCEADRIRREIKDIEIAKKNPHISRIKNISKSQSRLVVAA